MANQEAVEIASQSLDRSRARQHCRADATQIDRGSRDNVTAVVVDLRRATGP